MNLPQAEREFEALLYYLKHNEGCDLTGYKRSTLQRRLQVRMQAINIDNTSRLRLKSDKVNIAM